MIPKIIHQIHIGEKQLSYQELVWQETWKDLNPDWLMILWDDEKLKNLRIKNKKEFDDCSSFSMKSDILRFEILYKYGGLYIDTDFECLKNINPLVRDREFVICKYTHPDDYRDILCGAFLAATPRNKIIKKLIQGIPYRSKTHKDSPANVKYGPWYITDNVNTELALNSIYVYPYLFGKDHTPCPNCMINKYHRNFKEIFPQSYAVHHWSGSWIDPK